MQQASRRSPPLLGDLRDGPVAARRRFCRTSTTCWESVTLMTVGQPPAGQYFRQSRSAQAAISNTRVPPVSVTSRPRSAQEPAPTHHRIGRCAGPRRYSVRRPTSGTTARLDDQDVVAAMYVTRSVSSWFAVSAAWARMAIAALMPIASGSPKRAISSGGDASSNGLGSAKCRMYR